MPTAPLLDRQGLVHTTWDARRFRIPVMPEIAVAKIREDAPFDKVCYIGCVTTGSARSSMARRRANVVVSAWRHRPQRAGRAWSAPISHHRFESEGAFSSTDAFRESKEVGGDLVAHLWRSPTAGPVVSNASATSTSCARHWVLPSRLGTGNHRRRIRQGDSTRPFQLVTGRV